jgi:hypothetical protein
MLWAWRAKEGDATNLHHQAQRSYLSQLDASAFIRVFLRVRHSTEMIENAG